MDARMHRRMDGRSHEKIQVEYKYVKQSTQQSKNYPTSLHEINLILNCQELAKGSK